MSKIKFSGEQLNLQHQITERCLQNLNIAYKLFKNNATNEHAIILAHAYDLHNQAKAQYVRMMG
jgi:hypothetical protein